MFNYKRMRKLEVKIDQLRLNGYEREKELELTKEELRSCKRQNITMQENLDELEKTNAELRKLIPDPPVRTFVIFFRDGRNEKVVKARTYQRVGDQYYFLDKKDTVAVFLYNDVLGVKS